MNGNRFSTILILLVSLSVASCLPTSPRANKKKSSTSSSSTAADSGSASAPTFADGDELYWYSGVKVFGELTINQNTQQVAYLRGSDVHNFLDSNSGANAAKRFCMVFTYDDNDAKEQIRARAVPISFVDFTTNELERLFRIDFPTENSNLDFCTGTVDSISLAADIAYVPSDFCTNCTKIISSESIKLYQSQESGGAYSISDLTNVPDTDLALTSLNLRVDTVSGAISPESTCSHTICNAKGFDCCLNGQCVDDGQIKPNASTHSDYAQALADVALNPLNFINWPSIYYICTNIPHPDPTPTPFDNPDEAADAAFEQLKKDYLCLEGAKEEPANYETGSCSDSQWDDTGKTTCELNGTCSDPSFTTQATCEVDDVWTFNTWTYNCGGNTESDYHELLVDVWRRCGCQADPFPDPANPDDFANTKCPDFGLKAEIDESDTILEVTCDIPDPGIEPTPFQELELTMSARSVPHRFFRGDDHKAVDFLEELDQEDKDNDLAPEGTEFSYLDEGGKTEPQENKDYNINSILGQMKVDLTRAQPAKVVYLEHGHVYWISAISGFHNPCPQCSKDAWFETFTAFPSSQRGRGLEAVAHTTRRDNYDINLTFGNYEDTVFGRACWLPPTMIPLTHMKTENVEDQRERRLAAQTFFWVNGYQKDWYGFNRGALIGSFDGVKWFAVGVGRKVISTSKRLFLAINAPYADLAEPTSLTVSIIHDPSDASVAPIYDYDPEKEDFDSEQNVAGLCQKYHYCETDSDCVTNLGWEYMCADISKFNTYWPDFDINGDEVANEEHEFSTFNKILQLMPVGSKKRCVYRGMGAPCWKNPAKKNIFEDDQGSGRRKMLTCAPNFYCADLESGSFNDRVIREPNNTFTFLYGQEADVLGRPEDYLNPNKSLGSFPDIKENITHNLTLYNHATNGENESSISSKSGICMPGREISESVVESHGERDSRDRTDFISQIGSCDSEAVGNGNTLLEKTMSCPLIDLREKFWDAEDKEFKDNPDFGNYVFDGVDTGCDPDNNCTISEMDHIQTFPGWNAGPEVFQFARAGQNMCGGQVRTGGDSNSLDAGYEGSLFSDFELSASPNEISVPGLVQNACFRLAGSPCHTDLDCAPNKFHGELTQLYDKDDFGGTEAEFKFWQETLICGQRKPKPLLSDDYYNDYKLSENRCCREIGNNFTMYTDSANTNSDLEVRDVLPEMFEDGDDGILDGNKLDAGEQMGQANNPSGSGWGSYSRYNVLGYELDTPLDMSTTYGAVTVTGVGNTMQPYYAKPYVNAEAIPPRGYQWKTFQDTGRKTCCGGNHIRLFADGTNDWTNRNRLILDPKMFTCLNYSSEYAILDALAPLQQGMDTQNNAYSVDVDHWWTGRNVGDSGNHSYDQELARGICFSPGSGWADDASDIVGGGCSQIPIPDSDDSAIDFIQPPSDKVGYASESGNFTLDIGNPISEQSSTNPTKTTFMVNDVNGAIRHSSWAEIDVFPRDDDGNIIGLFANLTPDAPFMPFVFDNAIPENIALDPDSFANRTNLPWFGTSGIFLQGIPAMYLPGYIGSMANVISINIFYFCDGDDTDCPSTLPDNDWNSRFDLNPNEPGVNAIETIYELTGSNATTVYGSEQYFDIVNHANPNEAVTLGDLGSEYTQSCAGLDFTSESNYDLLQNAGSFFPRIVMLDLAYNNHASESGIYIGGSPDGPDDTADQADINAMRRLCIIYESGTDRPVLLWTPVKESVPANFEWDYAGIRIQYFPPGTPGHLYDCVPHETRDECWGRLNGETAANQGINQFSGLNAGMTPGNSLYYLTKLGRLELLGIPQIFYEPIRCNSNRSKILPGLYKGSYDGNEAPVDAYLYDDLVVGTSDHIWHTYDVDTSRTFRTRTGTNGDLERTNDISLIGIYSLDHTGVTDSYTNDQNCDNNSDGAFSGTEISGVGGRKDPCGNPDLKVAYQNGINHDPIWKENEFKCCAELGSDVLNAGDCCSGYATPDPNNSSVNICKLPQGTNLNVYFNRFVSSEGIDPDLPGGGFEDEDFIPETGELKLDEDVYDKLVDIGREVCENGTVRQGAAFGNYLGEPNNLIFASHVDSLTNQGKIFGILDKFKDGDLTSPAVNNDPGKGTGYAFFTAGYRWNHHYYCWQPGDGN